MMIITKNHHAPPMIRPDTDLGEGGEVGEGGGGEETERQCSSSSSDVTECIVYMFRAMTL